MIPAAAGVLLLLALTTWGILPWITLPKESRPDSGGETQTQGRSSIRTLLLAMVVVAFILAAVAAAPSLTAIGLAIVAVGLAVWSIATARHRAPAQVGAAAAMYLPFAWVLGGGPGLQNAEQTWLVAGVPGFFPAALVSSLMNQNHHDNPWMPLLITALFSIATTWLRMRGVKRAAAFAILLALMSACGSMVLNMLMRM